MTDPFGAAGDEEMPSLTPALEPNEAQQQFDDRLGRLAGDNGRLDLREIRVTRYKPGRRCVIEYDLIVERPDAPPEEVTLIGKVRVRRFGKSGYRLLKAFWEAGFEAEAPDGISSSPAARNGSVTGMTAVRFIRPSPALRPAPR